MQSANLFQKTGKQYQSIRVERRGYLESVAGGPKKVISYGAARKSSSKESLFSCQEHSLHCSFIRRKGGSSTQKTCTDGQTCDIGRTLTALANSLRISGAFWWTTTISRLLRIVSPSPQTSRWGHNRRSRASRKRQGGFRDPDSPTGQGQDHAYCRHNPPPSSRH
jgi:hypothetical protein